MEIVVFAIVMEYRSCASEVNKVLSKFGDYIRGRMGLPLQSEDAFVITLVMEANTDVIGAMAGQLGNIAGVRVKSVYIKK